MTGATQRTAWTSAYQSVSWAARVDASSSDFQNRERESRTYQFERSSTAPRTPSRAGRVVGVECRAALAHQRLRARDDPAVEGLHPLRPGPAASVAASGWKSLMPA